MVTEKGDLLIVSVLGSELIPVSSLTHGELALQQNHVPSYFYWLRRLHQGNPLFGGGPQKSMPAAGTPEQVCETPFNQGIRERTFRMSAASPSHLASSSRYL